MSVTDRVQSIIEPVLADLGLELYDLEHGGGSLRVTVDRQGGVDGPLELGLSQLSQLGGGHERPLQKPPAELGVRALVSDHLRQHREHRGIGRARERLLRLDGGERLADAGFVNAPHQAAAKARVVERAPCAQRAGSERRFGIRAGETEAQAGVLELDA